MEIKKILGLAYSTLHAHVKVLKRFKIVDTEKGKSKKKRLELKLVKHNDVELLSLSGKGADEIKILIDRDVIKSKKAEDKFKKWLENVIKETSELKTIRKSTKKQ